MLISFQDLIPLLAREPALGVTALLLLGVVLVNGWTDAPNAIATAVSSGALSFPKAAALAAVCNLLGVVGMTALNASVAETLYGLASFGEEPSVALTALCAAMIAIILYSALAWRFGIPTSESHALIAGLTGAALALPGGLGGVNPGAWGKVLLGLLLSVGLGAVLGRLALRLLNRAGGTPSFFCRAQILGAAVMAFFHGAQDGQKFMGVFLLAAALATGQGSAGSFRIPLWLMLLCALTMALGTAFGGRRIIDTVGRDMTSLTLRSGFAADLGAGCCLLLCSVLGLPVSTTHAKTAAILGVGRQVDRSIARSILLAWVCTFPCCGLIGFFSTKVLLLLTF